MATILSRPQCVKSRNPGVRNLLSSKPWLFLKDIHSPIENHAMAHARLTHWGRNKMKIADIFQTILSNAFSRMKMYEFYLKFHWILFLILQLTILQHWVRQCLGGESDNNPLSEPIMVSLLTHICGTRPQLYGNLVILLTKYLPPGPGPRLNIKTVLSTYGDFHVKDKTAVRTSYL